MSIGGRGVRNRKTRVNEARSIDILDLQHKEVFSKDSTRSWRTSWSQNGEMVASISYRVESDENEPSGLRFMYTVTDNSTGEKRGYNYIIPVISTRCNYGGKRWWFVCPLVVNGQPCKRRSRIVYMPSGAEFFGCRECHRLTYESRQRHREKFYEGFEKPYKAIESMQLKLPRTKSLAKREKLWRKLLHAHAAIENYNNNLIYNIKRISSKEN